MSLKYEVYHRIGSTIFAKVYRKHGLSHREDGPAHIMAGKFYTYYICGKRI